MEAAKHTILLMQVTKNKTSRSFSDHETVTQSLEALINMFETRLKEEHQHEEQVQYSVRDLYSFMDSVSELTVLVWDPSIKAYVPHDKDWVKTKIYEYLLEMSK